jgi:membrane protein YdbS with pleckstrin-like domain
VSVHDATGPSLREPANRLDEKVVQLWTVQGLIATAIPVVLVSIIVGGIAARSGGLWQLLWIAPAVLAVGGVLGSLLVPRFLYRFYRWEVTDIGMFVREGWLFRRWTIVPHARIQTVDTSSGPIQRSFGLATVEVRTAAGEGVSIPGLSEELVARLTEELAAKTGRGEGA